MSPIAGIILGALMGGFLVWGIMEFIWRGKLIELQTQLEQQEPGEAATDQAEPTETGQSLPSEAATLSAAFEDKFAALERDKEALKSQIEDLESQVTKAEAQKYLEHAAKVTAETDMSRIQSEKTLLEGQVSRLQLEKASLASEVERLKFLVEQPDKAPSQEESSADIDSNDADSDIGAQL